MPTKTTCGISNPFGLLSPASGQVAHVLRDRSPLGPKPPFDLHFLGTPQAFVLSQDQTLREWSQHIILAYHMLDFLRACTVTNHRFAFLLDIPKDASLIAFPAFIYFIHDQIAPVGVLRSKVVTRFHYLVINVHRRGLCLYFEQQKTT